MCRRQLGTLHIIPIRLNFLKQIEPNYEIPNEQHQSKGQTNGQEDKWENSLNQNLVLQSKALLSRLSKRSPIHSELANHTPVYLRFQSNPNYLTTVEGKLIVEMIKIFQNFKSCMMPHGSPISSVVGCVMTRVPRPGCLEIRLS